nr:aftiphilin-like [Nerophis lumbriciformis]
MEPDVIRLYSSSPPPMEDAEEEDEDEFGDFGGFSTVSASVSFSELDAPEQAHAPDATSPPELLNGRTAVPGMRHEVKANGVAPGSHPALILGGDHTDLKKPDPHIADGEIITNGFTTSDVKPGPQMFVRRHADSDNGSVDGVETEFADFAAFSNTDRQGCVSRCVDGTNADEATPNSEAKPLSVSRNTQPDSERSDADFAHHAVVTCTKEPHDGVQCDGVCLNGVDDIRAESPSVNDASHLNGVSIDEGAGVSSPSDERISETETETSLGRPLSTDALEEYGDMSTTGSAPSPPPLQEENADHSQLEDDEEFGDFGDAGSYGEQAFVDFNHQEVCPPQADDSFGEFNAPKLDEEGGDSLVSSSGTDGEWKAFGEAAQVTEGESTTTESWAAFGSEGAAEESWHEAETSSTVDQDNSRHTNEVLWSRVEKLLEASFPQPARCPSPSAEERIVSLKTLLKAPEDVSSALHGGVWSQLQDIHEAVGLRHQWGGSYCNKTLLSCLGIDTRNILFTGQKKQPLIVPVYAASLGMLEPTKEPVKPISAAEMIASIAQAPAEAPDCNSCPTDAVQEVLPPVQFDWSSSGLTNPLDASGGSFLLNLDFFGPVDDSGSSCSPAIPGVDPELVELTTAKMDSGGTGSRVVDAFARLMSTMDKTSTSTRKPRKDEKLSSEAAEVIGGLPDLSFMMAKVLMFPATLTPLASRAAPD